MLVGILSDTHDNFTDLVRVLNVFEERRVETILHAGDMIGSGNCYAFEGCRAEVKLVYGNNDGDHVGLRRDFERVGGEYLGDFGDLEVDGLKVALLHGTCEAVVSSLVRSEEYDVVVRGHNHLLAVDRRDDTLVINPGEVWGSLSGRKTAVILDTSTLEVEVLELGRVPSIRDILATKGFGKESTFKDPGMV